MMVFIKVDPRPEAKRILECFDLFSGVEEGTTDNIGLDGFPAAHL